MDNLPTTLRLTHLTSGEIADLRDQIKLVAIPIGSIEQHGPNTSLDTDLVICEDLTLRLAKRFHPQVLVAPTIPFGMSAYHMGFPGTITLRTQTLLHILEDNLESLIHHGFTRFLLTNWHGGNESIMTIAMQTLPTRLPLEFLAGLSFYDLENQDLEQEIIQSETSGHADELETAELMALRPDRVKHSRLAAGAVSTDQIRMRKHLRHHAIRRSFDFSDMTTNGAVGNARLATTDDGERMIQAIEAQADKLVKTILDAPEDLIARGRIPAWRNRDQAQ